MRSFTFRNASSYIRALHEISVYHRWRVRSFVRLFFVLSLYNDDSHSLDDQSIM